MRIVSLIWLLSVWLLAGSARADVQRFAILIGNNRGHAEDETLRYAESDAAKLAKVLRELGGFAPADIVLLQSEDAEEVQSTLITINDRIRAAQALPNTETMLLVYYSGHADAQALRLGRSRLAFRQLGQLVRGSAAQMRVLVVDACRSGAITRVKGGKLVPPFALERSNLRGEGVAFLAASSESEDAQESDALQGSFFTHAFVSGLLGAADSNRNGEVVLEEAYAYAYEATIRATSRTFAGPQHPTFHYDVKGQGAVVLTQPAAARRRRAELTFPHGFSFLVLSDHEEGNVLGEVGARDAARTLSLPAGRFFVRGRGPDYLLEGTMTAAAGERMHVEADNMQRVAYARLVRKGAGSTRVAHALETGPLFRSRLPNASTPCWGAAASYRLALEAIGLTAALGGCASRFENESVKAAVLEYSLTLGATRTWDLPGLSIFGSAGVGATLTQQRFETLGRAPTRLSVAPLGYLGVGALVPIYRRAYVGLELRLEGQLMRLQETTLDKAELRAEAAQRSAAVVGCEF